MVFSSASWDGQDFEQALSGQVGGQPPLLKEHIQDLLDSVLRELSFSWLVWRGGGAVL